jgi:hypothetical protein
MSSGSSPCSDPLFPGPGDRDQRRSAAGCRIGTRLGRLHRRPPEALPAPGERLRQEWPRTVPRWRGRTRGRSGWRAGSARPVPAFSSAGQRNRGPTPIRMVGRCPDGSVASTDRQLSLSMACSPVGWRTGREVPPVGGVGAGTCHSFRAREEVSADAVTDGIRKQKRGIR